jgi:uncharacterized cupin superfamily protein
VGRRIRDGAGKTHLQRKNQELWDGAGKTHLQRKNQELFSFLEGKSRILKEKKKEKQKKKRLKKCRPECHASSTLIIW